MENKIKINLADGTFVLFQKFTNRQEDVLKALQKVMDIGLDRSYSDKKAGELIKRIVRGI